MRLKITLTYRRHGEKEKKKMNTETEVAYKNGYSAGLRDAVKHAHWIEQDLQYDIVYRCSACNEDYCTINGIPAENLWKYCPNCGAKMDGKENWVSKIKKIYKEGLKPYIENLKKGEQQIKKLKGNLKK